MLQLPTTLARILFKRWETLEEEEEEEVTDSLNQWSIALSVVSNCA